MPVKDSYRIGLGHAVVLDTQNLVMVTEEFVRLGCRNELSLVQSRNAIFGRTGRNDLCNGYRVASNVKWGLPTPSVEVLFFLLCNRRQRCGNGRKHQASDQKPLCNRV